MTGLLIGYLLGSLIGPSVSALLQRIGWVNRITTAMARAIDRATGERKEPKT